MYRTASIGVVEGTLYRVTYRTGATPRPPLVLHTPDPGLVDVLVMEYAAAKFPGELVSIIVVQEIPLEKLESL